MEHDVNNILDNLASTYANQIAQVNKQVAILTEENRLLKEQVKDLKEFSRGTEKENAE